MTAGQPVFSTTSGCSLSSAVSIGLARASAKPVGMLLPAAQQGSVQLGSLWQGRLQRGTLQQGSMQQGSLQQGSWVLFDSIVMAAGQNLQCQNIGIQYQQAICSRDPAKVLLLMWPPAPHPWSPPPPSRRPLRTLCKTSSLCQSTAHKV